MSEQLLQLGDVATAIEEVHCKGVAELVDCEGNVTSSCTIDWRDRPIQQRLSEIAPARVESDVRAAAVGDDDVDLHAWGFSAHSLQHDLLLDARCPP